jgi:hypothetical protein
VKLRLGLTRHAKHRGEIRNAYKFSDAIYCKKLTQDWFQWRPSVGAGYTITEFLEQENEYLSTAQGILCIRQMVRVSI